MRRPVTLHVFHCPRLLPLAIAGSNSTGSEGDESQGQGIVLPLSEEEARLFLRGTVSSSNPTHPRMKDSSTPAAASVFPPPRAPTSPRPTASANNSGVGSSGAGSVSGTSSSSSMHNNQHSHHQNEEGNHLQPLLRSSYHYTFKFFCITP